MEIERCMRELIVREGLDDVARLLLPREWDEVPFVSRRAHVDFLAGLDVEEKSRLLVVHATRHLDRILASPDASGRDLVVLLSVTSWDDVKDGDPVIPNYWISTHPARDLVSFHLRPGTTREGERVREWLRSGGLLADHDVFDPGKPDRAVMRVYVARAKDERVARYVDDG